MANTVEHIGVVSRITSSHIIVSITVHEACSKCRAKSACGMGESGVREINIPLEGAPAVEVGESVMVQMLTSAGFVATAFAYVVPVVMVVGVLALGNALEIDEGVTALAALGGVAFYFLCMWLFRSRLAAKFEFSIKKL